ncbi:DNA mismatch repair endonuclease MutL [Methanofollis ethanolicus]|uniref:DNA mismatch repair endonuclease MutL n=1 Tax=Methanofollis ethanolicus TaxID=488124 RepID=UPI000832622F|nr:DNA mismatch repair endonuclease MutL [Methanofollis ethanolicus]
MTGPVIHVLDERTVNQIAAGEVVERPASVVKELVENAIDAGADLIRVEVTTDRTHVTVIRVQDNGVGMDRADAALAFREHATSKIARIDDLDRVATMGFRGEALASIASVADVTLVTRPKGGEVIAGTKVRIRGGGAPEVAEVGAPEGTTLEVRDLFFNTPARRKFLKSLHTELAHIHGVVERTALAHPEVSFRLVHNGRERVATHRTTDLRETAASLFGTDLHTDLIPLAFEASPVKVGGYISRPAHSRADLYQVFLSINARPISSPAIVRALKEGYGTLLPADRYPVAFVTLTVDPAQVDVNVHPTKKLVRLSREREICDAIVSAVRAALDGRDLLSAPAARPAPAWKLPAPVPPRTTGIAEAPALYARSDRRLRQTSLPLAGAERNLLPEIEVLGQVDATYIVGRAENRSLVVIDQHAAHERILYEQATEKQQDGQKTQELIVPVLITFTAQEAELVKDALPALEEEGFALGEFGPDTYAVSAIPIVLGRMEDPAVVRDLVSALIREAPRDPVGRREAITRRVACRGAIKAGDPLTHEQMRRLVDQLAHTKSPYTCPHGRPTVLSFSPDELAAMFRRT